MFSVGWKHGDLSCVCPLGLCYLFFLSLLKFMFPRLCRIWKAVCVQERGWKNHFISSKSRSCLVWTHNFLQREQEPFCRGHLSGLKNLDRPWGSAFMAGFGGFFPVNRPHPAMLVLRPAGPWPQLGRLYMMAKEYFSTLLAMHEFRSEVYLSTLLLARVKYWCLHLIHFLPLE